MTQDAYFINVEDSRPKGVPADAYTTLYVAGRREGRIWWWPSKQGWYWEAGGNNGEESTEDMAKERARRWIRDGQ